ncbi:MAG: hypothetical protein C4315_09590 [Chloroflexota bacterium]
MTALRVGEVIETATSRFVVHCYDLHGAPPLGSLVRTGPPERPVFGLVGMVRTASIDPGRRPVARGREEVDPEEIFNKNPHLTQLFRTEFEAITVGYAENGAVRQTLPPSPPRIHDFVYLCTPQEALNFTERLDFLALLLEQTFPAPVDELVAAAIRRAAGFRPEPEEFLVRAGRELARLLAPNPTRLQLLLRRLRHEA